MGACRSAATFGSGHRLQLRASGGKCECASSSCINVTARRAKALLQPSSAPVAKHINNFTCLAIFAYYVQRAWLTAELVMVSAPVLDDR